MARNSAGPTRATCDLVDARDAYTCARCGHQAQGGSRHHRQLRRHGDHSPANLVLVCGSGTTGCHGWAHGNPAEAYKTGWLVHSWHNPEHVPIQVAGSRGSTWALLDRAGSRHTMSNTDAHARHAELGLD